MKVPSFSTTLARQRHDAEVEARQREFDATFNGGSKVIKFYLLAEVDDGLPPIKQEISSARHAAFVAFENIDPSVPKNNVMNVESDVAD